MPRGIPVDDITRKRIVKAYKEGLNMIMIMYRFNLTYTAVARIIKDYKENE